MFLRTLAESTMKIHQNRDYKIKVYCVKAKALQKLHSTKLHIITPQLYSLQADTITLVPTRCIIYKEIKKP